MEQVRFGIVGLGNMGRHHAHALASIKNAELTAVCDVDDSKCRSLSQELGVPGFANHHEMFDSGLIDAVIVATPHYSHPPIAIDAFAKGLHAYVEKPIAVSVKAARELNEAAKKYPKIVFGIGYQQRSKGIYQKIRSLIAEGELGEVSRITWIITDWFRTWAYYASGGWRATWEGEGGGVLINQCPHNLDLIQWTTGMMPSRVTAVGAVGKYHPIEVEDDISAILEYPNGAVGHFVTTTGEAPGTNRLEIACDRGKLVAEGSSLKFWRTRKSVRDVRENDPGLFAHAETWQVDIPVSQSNTPDWAILMQNFVDAVLKGTPLLAPGVEGVRGLEIGNAIMMSALTRKPVDLPVDGDAYDLFIKDMARKYGGKKTVKSVAATQTNMEKTFG